MATCTTCCIPETNKMEDTKYSSNTLVCLYKQVNETCNRWPQWLRSGL